MRKKEMRACQPFLRITHYELRARLQQPAPDRGRDQDGADGQHGQQRSLILVFRASEHVLNVVDKAAGLLPGAHPEAALAVGAVAEDAQLVAVESLAAAGADSAVDEPLALLVGVGPVG